MYERLDRLHDELRKAERGKEDADKKLKIAQDRLREVESTQILAGVEALHLMPEQVGQFLSMATNRQLPGVGMDPRRSGSTKENVRVEDIAGTSAGQGDNDLKDNDSGKDAEVYGACSDISRGTEDELTGDREDEYNA